MDSHFFNSYSLLQIALETEGIVKCNSALCRELSCSEGGGNPVGLQPQNNYLNSSLGLLVIPEPESHTRAWWSQISAGLFWKGILIFDIQSEKQFCCYISEKSKYAVTFLSKANINQCECPFEIRCFLEMKSPNVCWKYLNIEFYQYSYCSSNKITW